MYRFKLLGLALMAVFALGVVASSSALALENPEILPNPTAKAPVNLKAEGGKAVLAPSVGKQSIECEKTSAKGKFEAASKGTVTIDFTNCKSGAVKCWSLGDETAGAKKETILVDNAELQLVDVLPASALALGTAIKLSSELHLECQGGLLVLIEGTAIGEVKGVESGKIAKTGELVYTQTKGIQAIRACDLPKVFCEKTYELSTNFGGGFESSGQEAKATVTFEPESVIDF